MQSNFLVLTFKALGGCTLWVHTYLLIHRICPFLCIHTAHFSVLKYGKLVPTSSFRFRLSLDGKLVLVMCECLPPFCWVIFDEFKTHLLQYQSSKRLSQTTLPKQNKILLKSLSIVSCDFILMIIIPSTILYHPGFIISLKWSIVKMVFLPYKNRNSRRTAILHIPLPFSLVPPASWIVKVT